MPASKSSLPATVSSTAEWIAYGREVIEIEAAALASLAATLDDNFAKAVSLIIATRGRVVVTGMGKSGHVARKIAATLASISVPALFVHPAEAAHGDLGMLVPGDTVIALSNSGATRELLPLVDHAKQLGVPIIAIASQARSPLMEDADIRLLLPPADEACPAKLAPTTSTAMMMAMGDALAMVAMRLRGLSRAGFGALHPGGSIGSRLVRVSAIMQGGARMPLVAPTDLMSDVIVRMTSDGFGIAGVADEDGRLIGVITDGDLRRHVRQLLDSTASEVMTRHPVTIVATSLAEDALALMNRHKITAVFVTDERDPDRPVGIVHIHNFLSMGLS